MENIESVKNFSEIIARIKSELKKDVVGQEDIVDNVIIAIIAGGNVLLEGVPGVGKTRLVRTLGLPFSFFIVSETAGDVRCVLPPRHGRWPGPAI